MPQNNVPDPSMFATGGNPSDDLFAKVPPGGYTAEGEAALIDVIRDGVNISTTGDPSGGVSIDLLPKTLADPPRYVRLFGALYQRVDTISRAP